MITKVMDSDRRLLLDLKYFSTREKIRPMPKPSSSEQMISSIGSSRMLVKSNIPTRIALAAPKLTANTIRPTASSSATIGSSRSVSLPLALYWRTTISVAAGAVAVAIAPRVMASASGSLSPSMNSCSAMSTTSTSSAATSAWKMPMTVA